MPLLSTFGASSVRGWGLIRKPPTDINIFMVGGGGQIAIQTHNVFNSYGHTTLYYNTGGKSGQVKIRNNFSVTPGTTYSISAGGPMQDTTAFGLTATSGNGSGGGSSDGPGGTFTYSSGTTFTEQFYVTQMDYWGDYYAVGVGGQAMGGSGAGSGGNGVNGASGTPGVGGANVNGPGGLSIGVPVITPGGGPGYGQYIYYGAQYSYFNGYSSNFEGQIRDGSGGNGGGTQPAQQGAVMMFYSDTFDDPQNIAATYTKYTGGGFKFFLFRGNSGGQGTVKF